MKLSLTCLAGNLIVLVSFFGSLPLQFNFLGILHSLALCFAVAGTVVVWKKGRLGLMFSLIAIVCTLVATILS